MRRERVSVGNKHISYLVSAPSEKADRTHPVRTVVLLHAFPLQASMWEATLGAMPDGWRAIAPDFRGFGESRLPPKTTFRMSELAGDVIDLLDHLEIHDAVVVGCSMGGYVLFDMLRSAPSYMSAIGLVSTRPGADNDEGRKNRQKAIDLVEGEGVEAIANQMIPKLLGATAQRERPDLMKHLRNLILRNAPEGISSALKTMRDRSDSTAALAKIGVPTLIVAGAEDALIPPSEAENMHRAIPTSRCEIIPGAGHLPNLEQPEAFHALLSEFLHKL
jgi:3-oxoadipate enol-lactonase